MFICKRKCYIFNGQLFMQSFSKYTLCTMALVIYFTGLRIYHHFFLPALIEQNEFAENREKWHIEIGREKSICTSINVLLAVCVSLEVYIIQKCVCLFYHSTALQIRILFASSCSNVQSKLW